MNKSTKTLLESLPLDGAGRISTALGAVEGVVSCGLDVCKRYFADLDAGFLRRSAARQLVYTDADLVIEAKGDSLKPADGIEIPKSTLMLLRPIVTTTKRDRDGDVLETKGAVVGGNPLLWQHVATVPIGVRLATVEHTDTSLKFLTALLDLNDLTEDAAKLIEAGALSISHGFKSLLWSRLPGPDGKEPGKGEHYGFHVHKFEIMEHSLVSVPSNTDAVITAYSRNKLRSELAKKWAKSQFDSRDVAVAVKAKCECGKKEAGESVPPPQVAAAELAVKMEKSRYVAGSWEDIESTLAKTAKGHLENYGIKVGYNDYCNVCGTFADYAYVCVDNYMAVDYYKIAWAMVSGRPVWTGAPEKVAVGLLAGGAMASESGESDESGEAEEAATEAATKSEASKSESDMASKANAAQDAPAVIPSAEQAYAFLLSADKSQLARLSEVAAQQIKRIEAEEFDRYFAGA